MGKETSMLHVTPRARNGRRAKVAAKEVCGGKTRASRKKIYAHACRARMSHDVPASSRCRVATKLSPPHARLHPLSTQVQRRKPGPTRKKTETHNKAEAGKKCMSGRRVEESIRATKPQKEQGVASGLARGALREGDTAGTRRAQHCTETPEMGAPEEQGKSGTAHHDTHSTDTTHTAQTQRAPATRRAVGGQSGEGQRLTSGAPHNGGRQPPRGRPSATPTASNAGPQGRTLWGRCWVHTPASTATGTHGSRNPGCPLQRTGGRGRDSA